MEQKKNLTAEWFECKVKYDKMQEDGTEKSVTELYTVDALTFTEAEARIDSEMKPFISGEFQIKSITRAPYREIFLTDAQDKYWKVKVAFITIDEKTHKEKRTFVMYLCQANRADEADQHVREIMGLTMTDYAIVGVTETKIMDVYVHE